MASELGFGAILHRHWKKDSEPTKIVGYWAEDGSLYTITTPEQLRDMIVNMQNRLSDTYQKIQVLRNEIRHLENFLP